MKKERCDSVSRECTY